MDMLWRNLNPTKPTDSVYYSVLGLADPNNGMEALRELFPGAQANDLNFCLFSTSGVHGTYNLIEGAEAYIFGEDKEACGDVTFVVVQPRIVCIRYGNAKPRTPDDFAFLKALRASSIAAATSIGMPHHAQVLSLPNQSKSQ